VFIIGAGLVCLAFGLWQTFEYNRGQHIAASLQWTVCGATNFTFDTVHNNGIMSIVISEEPWSWCKWVNVIFFQCADGDARCIRDNTNRFHNHAWSCVINVDERTDCSVLPLADWPDLEAEYRAYPISITCFVLCGFFFLCIIFYAELSKRPNEKIPLLNSVSEENV
jgi:hypothetical protein